MILPLLKNISTKGYSETVSKCMERLERKIKTSIFTPNSEMLYKASRSRELQELLLSADLLFPDGIGVFAAVKALGVEPKERTAGIELAELIMKSASKYGYKVFLLGSRPGVAAKASKQLQNKYQGLKICGYHHGYFSKSGNENRKIIEKINHSKADILFVCLGFPEQEKWISDNLKKLKTVKLAIGLGGSLDVWSGCIKRAPHALRVARLEWAWRMLREPKRLKDLPSLARFYWKT